MLGKKKNLRLQDGQQTVSYFLTSDGPEGSQDNPTEGHLTH